MTLNQAAKTAARWHPALTLWALALLVLLPLVWILR